jgi:hypothetical protein
MWGCCDRDAMRRQQLFAEFAEDGRCRDGPWQGFNSLEQRER